MTVEQAFQNLQDFMEEKGNKRAVFAFLCGEDTSSVSTKLFLENA